MFPSDVDIRLAAWHKISQVKDAPPLPPPKLWPHLLVVVDRDRLWDQMANLLWHLPEELVEQGFGHASDKTVGWTYMSDLTYSGLVLRNLWYIKDSDNRINQARYLAFLFYIHTAWVLIGKRPSFAPEEYYHAP